MSEVCLGEAGKPWGEGRVRVRRQPDPRCLSADVCGDAKRQDEYLPYPRIGVQLAGAKRAGPARCRQRVWPGRWGRRVRNRVPVVRSVVRDLREALPGAAVLRRGLPRTGQARAGAGGPEEISREAEREEDAGQGISGLPLSLQGDRVGPPRSAQDRHRSSSQQARSEGGGCSATGSVRGLWLSVLGDRAPEMSPPRGTMELEHHQLDLRYESLRCRAPAREKHLLASLAEHGQQVLRAHGLANRAALRHRRPLCRRLPRQTGRGHRKPEPNPQGGRQDAVLTPTCPPSPPVVGHHWGPPRRAGAGWVALLWGGVGSSLS